MTSERTTYCVYAIQLDGNPKNIYVGQTSHSPEERLKQHNSGLLENYSAKVFRKGVRGILRPDLYQYYPTYSNRNDALRAEIVFAEKLYGLGYSVHSDGLKKINKKNVKLLFPSRNMTGNASTSKKKNIKKKDSNNEPLKTKSSSYEAGSQHYNSDPNGIRKKSEAQRMVEFLEKMSSVILPEKEFINTMLGPEAPKPFKVKHSDGLNIHYGTRAQPLPNIKKRSKFSNPHGHYRDLINLRKVNSNTAVPAVLNPVITPEQAEILKRITGK